MQISPAASSAKPAGRPVLRACHVTKRYGDLVALDDVSIDVHEGEVVAVIGPSGSGKSTLVRCMHQLDSIQGGAIYLNDELLGYKRQRDVLKPLDPVSVARQRRSLGMVFQQFGLFPHMTALENIMEGPLRVLRDARADARERALRLLERVGLGNKADAYPQQLSGGQQQRVAIARALAMRPQVLLFDEPTSALDPELVGEVLHVVADLVRAGKTMVVVTHEIGFAREAADRIVFMEGGRIVEEGEARSVLSAPKTERLRNFLSHVV